MPSMGEIIAHLGLNDSKFKAGVNNVGQWSKAKFAAIGTAAAGAFAATFGIQKFTESLNFTARIKELSEQSGFTTEEFQKLAYQVRQAGGSMDDVVRAGNTLDRMLAKLAEGNNQAIKDFKTMGLEMDDLFSHSRLELMNQIQSTFMSLSEGQRGGFLDALRRLFGDDSAKRFIAAFQEGWVEGLEKAYIISEETINAAKELTGELQNLNDSVMKELANILADNKNEILEIIKFTGMAVEKAADLVNLMKIIYEGRFMNPLLPSKYENVKMAESASEAIPKKQANQTTENYLKEMRDSLKAIQSQPNQFGMSAVIMGE